MVQPNGTGTTTTTTTAEVKPGYTTSEFWVTILTVAVTAIVAIAGAFGVHVNGDKLQPLIGSLALVAAAVASGIYALARAHVKANHIKATMTTTVVTPTPLPAVTPAPVVTPVPPPAPPV